jgi:hypothetical protein
LGQDRITPGERRELRSVVRQQFKVLRTEVEQRKIELNAEAQRMVAERYRRQDQLHEQARRQLSDAFRRMVDDVRVWLDDLNVREGTAFRVDQDRYGGVGVTMDDNRVQERRALEAGLREQVKTAALNLDRQEADLLKTLAAEALETDEARGWLGRIPTVTELVPAHRLREIEAQFDREEGGP